MENIAMPGLFISVAAFILVIGVLIFVHEFGHYGMARLFGIKVETFSIGFGRELVGFTDRRGTRWKLGWLPLGGYAKFAGDMNAASQPDPKWTSLPEEERKELFQFRPIWQRALVVGAGPGINFIFAILLFMAFFMTWGHEITPAEIAHVAANTPAAEAGLQPGDKVQSIDGRRVHRFEDLQRAILINPGVPTKIMIERGGRTLEKLVTPKVVGAKDRFGNHYEVGLLGVGVPDRVVVRHGPVAALYWATVETWDLVRMLPEVLGQVLKGQRSVDEMGGPVRIAQASGQMAALGLPALISFTAFISINLGFMNLLPIPVLDGGHLFLYALEAVRRQPLSPKVQEWAFMSGFVLLMSMMLFLTLNDLRSVGLWQQLSAGFAG